MFPINNNEDLLTALSEDQEFRDRMRRVILTDDLLDLPARFDKHADETANLIREITVQTAENSRAIATLAVRTDENTRAIAENTRAIAENSQAITALAVRTDENTRAIAENTRAIAALTVQTEENTRAIAALTVQTEENTRAIAENTQAIAALTVQTEKNTQSIDKLTAQVSRNGGQLSNLTGAAFEQRNREKVRRVARDLFAMRETRLVSNVPALIEDAWSAGRINTEEAGDIENSDVVIQGITGPDDQTVYVVTEISITVQSRDVERAKRRANLLAQATGSHAIPAVAGINIPPDTDENGELAVIRLPAEAEQDS